MQGFGEPWGHRNVQKLDENSDSFLKGKVRSHIQSVGWEVSVREDICPRPSAL